MGNAGARLGLSLGLGLIGSYFGPVGFAIGSMVGGIIGSLVFPDKPQNSEQFGPRLQDLSVQTSTYGNGIPLLYGTVRVAGNVIWSTGLVEHINTVIQEIEGGKGGSQPTTTITTYTYTCSFAISLANNEIIGIKRIWTDDKLWFDFTDPPVGVSFAYELLLGTEDQLPCSAIEADKGAGNVPAFRGQAYIVFKDLDLTKFGNRVPNFHFEVVCAGSESLTAQHVVTVDDGVMSKWWTRLVIDTETGYLWSTNGLANLVSVVDPELNIIKQIQNEFSDPMGLAYQPAYMYLDLPDPFEIGAQPIVKEMPPRMWVSSDNPGFLNIGNAAAYCIETRTYRCVLNDNINGAIPGSAAHTLQPSLGNTVVDMRGIQLEDINSELGQKVHMFESGVTSGYAYTSVIGAPYSEFVSSAPNNLFNSGLDFTSLCNDAVCDDVNMLYLYHVDYRGKISAADYDMQIVFQRHDYTTLTFFNRLRWDKFERKLYAIIKDGAGANGRIVKYSEDLSVEHWNVPCPVTPIGTPISRGWVAFDVHPTTGALYALAQNLGDFWWLCEIDKTDGTILSDVKILNTQLRIWQDMRIYPNSMVAYVSWIGSGGNTENGIAKVPLVSAPESAYPTLKTVVEDISTRTGLTLADLNATALAADTVKGYALAQRMPARQAIEPLMAGYFFDAVESDYVAKFVKRGGASVKTITAEQTGAHELNSNPPPRREVTRIEENEMPWQVDVNYMDVESLYKINVQYARRLIGQSKSVLSANIAAVFSATDAKRIAEVILYNAWMDRQGAKMRLTCRHVELDPCDVITFQDADLSTQAYRVARAEYTYPNRLDLDLIEEDASVYVGTGIGVQADVPAQAIASLAPTLTYFLDIPIMGRAQDNEVGFYIAGGPSYGANWPGAGLYRSDSGGSFYTAITEYPSAATVAVAETIVPYEGSIP